MSEPPRRPRPPATSGSAAAWHAVAPSSCRSAAIRRAWFDGPEQLLCAADSHHLAAGPLELGSGGEEDRLPS